jgi:signal transduction histidine kinase
MAMADYPTPRLAPILVDLGIKHMASAPVISRGQIVGAINVGSHRLHPFTDEELDLLGSIGQQIGASVENAQLHAVTARQAQRLAMLTELTRSLTGVLEPAAVAQEILRAVQSLIPGSAGRLWERVADEDMMNVVAGVGLRDPQGGQRLQFYLGEGLMGLAAATRQPVISPEVTQDSRFVNKAWAAAEGLVSCIVLPLVYGNRIHGGLAIFTREPHTFPDEEVSLLRSFAAHAAITIQNARLFRSVMEQGEELRTLAARLAEAEEALRRRLTTELHDRVAQKLTALSFNLNLLRSEVPAEGPSKLAARLDDSVRLVETTLAQVRDLMQDLRPPLLDDHGLLATLRWYAEWFATRTGVATVVHGEELTPRLPPPTEMTLFRIVQEGLTNVAKHARASQVTLALEVAAADARLTITDDGTGFDPAMLHGRVGRTGWGLISMRERAAAVGGRVRVESVPGQGTRLVVEVPRELAPIREKP